jgi:transcriptional regulator with XRE-family HTH domain
MDIKKSFGEKLKRLRNKRKLTQEQLAEIIEMSPKNLSKIEVGASFVSSETLEKILVALDVTAEELFANDYIKTSEELISDIYNKVDCIKNNQQKLEITYKMLDFIISL